MSRDQHPRHSLRPFRPIRFGSFTLLLPLGAGGMGEIFLARSTFQGGLDRFCVIKRILPHLANDQEFVTRFLDEVRTLLQLQHGSIAQVYDAGVFENDYWISLEFVDGKDLRRLLQLLRGSGERMPIELALFVAIKVLEALAYAHRKKDDGGRELGLVHCDISPQNILLSYEGEVKVIDFGLAKSKTTEAKNPAQAVLGKLYYMAPEQGRGDYVDRRSDLYALGVVLWEMLVGKNPFEDIEPSDLLSKIVNPQLPPIRTVDASIPASIAAVVDRALSPEPFRRFATAEEMRSRLSACLAERTPDVGPDALGKWLGHLFREEYQRERELFLKLASKEESVGYDPDSETQVIMVSDKLPEAPPHSAATEIFHQSPTLPWQERPFLPSSPPAPRQEETPPVRNRRLVPLLLASGLSVILLGWWGWTRLDVLSTETASHAALEEPQEEPIEVEAEPPEVQVQASSPPPPLPPPAEPREAPPKEQGPPLSSPSDPTPPVRSRPVAAAAPQQRVADADLGREELEKEWKEIERRIDRLVSAFGEERVGSIVLSVRQAVETSMNRLLHDSAEYATLAKQLQALEEVVKEREDALR